MSKLNNQLAIITVVYQNYDVLEDFFKSLRDQTSKNFQLYIVDQSKDVKTIKYEGIRYKVIFSQNKGYSHGVNVGLKEAQKNGIELFCVLNNDTYFPNNFIDTVLNALYRNQDAIIGGKIYYASGYEYHKNSYRNSDLGKVIWYAGGHVDWRNALTPHRGVDEVDKGQYNKTENTNFITGTFMAFNQAVIEKVGFWDESYFLYFEDADWCERAKRKNIKLIYEPSIVIYHKVSQSTGGSGSSLHQKFQTRNRLKFALKYAPLRTKLHLIKNRLISFLQGQV